MSVRTVETRLFSCDRCDAEDSYKNDAEAGFAGWTMININNRRNKALCPADSNKLDFFLMGQKTGAGIRFNKDEDERLGQGQL